MLSDERIEIAEKLRGPFDVCECAGHTYINGTLFGMQVCARDELELRNGMRHLADLIDRPTCQMKSIPESSYRVCSRCGAFVRRDAVTNCTEAIHVRFCPNCGARVVRDNERGYKDSYR